MKKYRVTRALFYTASLFLVFLLGFAVSYFEVWPYGFLARALDEGRTLVSDEESPVPHHMHPPRHDLVGVAVYGESGPVPAAEADPRPGEYTLLTSYWPESGLSPGIRLIDRRGRVVHSWDVDIREIWPQSALEGTIARLQSEQRNYIHGTHLFENGDVLFNIEYLGLVRMDAAGDVVWLLDRHTHHSVERADDGNFWVCEMRLVTDPGEARRRFPGLSPPMFEDRVLKVSPGGEVLEEISVLELVFNSDHRTRLWVCTGYVSMPMDLLHLNDVEPLPAGMADEYPLFEAGDLVVSLRSLSMVFVFDPDSGRIKWARTGNLLLQHDPDFIGKGWISIYDNRSDRTMDGRVLGGSRLIAVRPHTGELRRIYPAPDSPSGHERHFYSSVGGKAQALPEGHWLITESTGARVFEIDAEGRTIWEWGHQPCELEGTTLVSEVLEGTRYVLDPGVVAGWTQR